MEVSYNFLKFDTQTHILTALPLQLNSTAADDVGRKRRRRPSKTKNTVTIFRDQNLQTILCWTFCSGPVYTSLWGYVLLFYLTVVLKTDIILYTYHNVVKIVNCYVHSSHDPLAELSSVVIQGNWKSAKNGINDD